MICAVNDPNGDLKGSARHTHVLQINCEISETLPVGGRYHYCAVWCVSSLVKVPEIHFLCIDQWQRNKTGWKCHPSCNVSYSTHTFHSVID